MKKILLAIAIASASLITLNSCTKEYITNNSYLPAITLVYERAVGDWKGTDNNAYVDLQVPELTGRIMDQGAVTVALSSNNETTFHTIPATINGVAYSFEYKVGRITIKAQDPILEDGILIEVPKLSVFKVTLLDADFVK